MAILFPSRFLGTVFSVILCVVVAIGGFIGHLLFVFFQVFGSNCLQGIARGDHRGNYCSCFQGRVGTIVRCQVGCQRDHAKVFTRCTLSCLVRTLLERRPFNPYSMGCHAQCGVGGVPWRRNSGCTRYGLRYQFFRFTLGRATSTRCNVDRRVIGGTGTCYLPGDRLIFTQRRRDQGRLDARCRLRGQVNGTTRRPPFRAMSMEGRGCQRRAYGHCYSSRQGLGSRGL